MGKNLKKVVRREEKEKAFPAEWTWSRVRGRKPEEEGGVKLLEKPDRGDELGSKSGGGEGQKRGEIKI